MRKFIFALPVIFGLLACTPHVGQVTSKASVPLANLASSEMVMLPEGNMARAAKFSRDFVELGHDEKIEVSPSDFEKIQVGDRIVLQYHIMHPETLTITESAR